MDAPTCPRVTSLSRGCQHACSVSSVRFGGRPRRTGTARATEEVRQMRTCVIPTPERRPVSPERPGTPWAPLSQPRHVTAGCTGLLLWGYPRAPHTPTHVQQSAVQQPPYTRDRDGGRVYSKKEQHSHAADGILHRTRKCKYLVDNSICVVLMLGQRRRRWPSIKITLDQRSEQEQAQSLHWW